MDRKLKKVVIKGLTSLPKYIPTWYNYDDIGSELENTGTVANSVYYFRPSQISILETYTQDIIPDVPYDLSLADLGSGNCSKSRYFLDELLKRQTILTFFPVDISGDFLKKTVETLSDEYGDNLTILPIAADYETGIEKLRKVKGPKLVLWLGSMISLSYEDQVETLKLIASVMSDRCHLVISVDINQDEQSVLDAYNDKAGFSKAFFQNSINRLIREEGSQLDLDHFYYHVDFISNTSPDYMSYVRVYIESKDTYQCNIEISMRKIESQIKNKDSYTFNSTPNMFGSCYDLEWIDIIFTGHT